LSKAKAKSSEDTVTLTNATVTEYVASLSRYKCEQPPRSAGVEALEKKLGGRFPEVMRQIFLKHGGLSFWSEQMSFSELRETAKQVRDFPEWIKDYLPFYREGGTMYLVRKSDSEVADPATYYYEFNAGMKAPATFTKSFTDYVRRGYELRKQYLEDNPDEQEDLGAP